MEDRKKNPGTVSKAPAGFTDARSKWAAEAGAAPATLEEIRVDQNERLLVPFTTSVEEVSVHFLEYPSLRGYVLCNGTDCLLCRIGRKADSRDLWPVYDVVARAVGVLPVAANLRPEALKPQLFPVLERVAANERVLLAVRKLDKYRFGVNLLPLPDEVDDGAEQITDFLDRVESGLVNLAGVYQRLSNEQLAGLPEVAIAAKVRGITL